MEQRPAKEQASAACLLGTVSEQGRCRLGLPQAQTQMLSTSAAPGWEACPAPLQVLVKLCSAELLACLLGPPGSDLEAHFPTSL